MRQKMVGPIIILIKFSARIIKEIHIAFRSTGILQKHLQLFWLNIEYQPLFIN